VARPLVLASRSPQRRAILEQLGVEFSVVVPDGVQELESGPPHEVALENAYRKATAVADGGRGVADGGRAPADGGGAPAHGGRATARVLGVDTIVAVGTRLYGKPVDADAARATLQALSGRAHAVISGVCVLVDGTPRTAAAQTVVEFRALDERLIDWYVASGEWRERAGGYAIQGRGAALVKRIDGDYSNVVGLPVTTLLELAPDLLGG
jgi:septum formation protein